MKDDDNPYRSPRTQVAPEIPIVGRGGKGVESRLVSRGWLYRKVEIKAPVDAMIEYRGQGFGESIYVNGNRASWNVSWWFVPLFEFSLDADGTILAVAVRIRTYPWMTLKALRIDIDGTQAYVEGSWPNGV